MIATLPIQRRTPWLLRLYSYSQSIQRLALGLGVTIASSECCFPQQPPASNSIPTNSSPPNIDSNKRLVQTFVDPRSGQLYGRYIVNETIKVASYEYKDVHEKLWLPEWVQSTKTTTQIQYVPLVTYQLQLRNVPSMIPFARQQQRWEYVPIVQYQPTPVQQNVPITHQQYVEKDITKRVPMLVTKDQQIEKYADLPINQPNQSSNPTVASTSATHFPTTPIGYPLPALGPSLAQSPPAYYPSNPTNLAAAVSPQLTSSVNPSNPSQPGSTLSSYPAFAQQLPNQVPVWNGTQGYNTRFVNNAFPNQGAGNTPYWVQSTPNSRLNNPLSGLMTKTGALFQNTMFQSPRSSSQPSNYVASLPNSNTVPNFNSGQQGAPLFGGFWGNNPNRIGSPGSPNLYPTNNSNWGLTPVNNFREPSQGGFQPTVLR